MEDNGTADLTNPRVTEMNYFRNIFETEVKDVQMNHTQEMPGRADKPDKSAYLYWVGGTQGMDKQDKSVGPAIALKVNAGDKVNLETWARYEHKEDYTEDISLMVFSQLLGSSFAYIQGFDAMPVSKATETFQSALPALTGAGVDASQPRAFLNYIVFNSKMESIASDRVQVSEAAGFEPDERAVKGMHEKLAMNVSITETGYIYAWVSNGSENTKVWFDDFSVSHTSNFVAQATDFGAWGDVLREQKTDESIYRYSYQGQFSERDLETSWNHFEAREFDPTIGRWTSPDPAREFWSRYLGMGNNPVLFVDPNGETIIIGGYTYVPGQEYTGKNMFIAGVVKSLNRLYQAEQKLGKSIIGDLSKPGVELQIMKSSIKTMGYKGDGTLGANLNSGLYTYDGDPKKGGKVTGTQSAEIGLMHEIMHAYDDLIGKTWYEHYKDESTMPDFSNMAEKIAVDIENEFIRQMNLMFNLNNMIRLNDYGVPFKTESPESNTPVYNTKGDRVD
jgi:RHS repeat-associated protein